MKHTGRHWPKRFWIPLIALCLSILVRVSPPAAVARPTTPAPTRAARAAAQAESVQRQAAENLEQQARDPLNATYRVQKRDVTLDNGRSEMFVSQGSATYTKTTVRGNAVPGDLDRDGDEDAALLLVQEPGGSGTFYYVAAALNENGRYRGTNAVLIGDRIIPGGLTIREGTVKVNYFDRPENAPMSRRPSVAMQSNLVLDRGVLTVAKTGRHALIQVAAPLPGDAVASPLTVQGSARGMWFFEGDFPLRLEDRNGNVIARGYATAKGPWMTEEFVPFEGTLEFTKPPGEDSGMLILKKDNPSDRRELDDEIGIPIRLE